MFATGSWLSKSAEEKAEAQRVAAYHAATRKPNRLRTRVMMELRTLVQTCWAKDPEKRPDFGKVVQRLKTINDKYAFEISDEFP